MVSVEHLSANVDVGDVGVPLLRWPGERERAASLEDDGLPFLLLVGEHEPPPISGYRFMDWVRSPVDPDELVARRSSLEDRFVHSRHGPWPQLDVETGRLSFCHARADMTPSHLDLVQELVAHYREIVPRSDVRDLLGVAPDEEELLASRLVRVRRHVRAVGLDVRRVRRIGYVLEPLPRD